MKSDHHHHDPNESLEDYVRELTPEERAKFATMLDNLQGAHLFDLHVDAPGQLFFDGIKPIGADEPELFTRNRLRDLPLVATGQGEYAKHYTPAERRTDREQAEEDKPVSGDAFCATVLGTILLSVGFVALALL